MKMPMALRAHGAAVAAGRAHRRIRPCRSAARGPIASRRPRADPTTITEDGEVYNLIFRFMSRFVFGHTATMDAFLKNLERRPAPVTAADRNEMPETREELASAPKSRIEKLGVKDGARRARPRRRRATAPSWTSCAQRGAATRTRGSRPADMIFAAVPPSRRSPPARAARARLQPDGMLWTLRPKGSKDLTERR